MGHRLRNVQELHEDSKKLYNEVVLGKADGIINSLEDAINNLESNWEGKDAGVQIQNVVEVHNAMAKLRNALALLAGESSKVAADYREIQNLNRANMENLAPLTVEGNKKEMARYEDNRDTVHIDNEALRAQSILNNVLAQYDDFKSQVTRYYDAIMDNWQEGLGRETAREDFEAFMASSDKYKEILHDVSQSITDSFRNYMM